MPSPAPERPSLSPAASVTETSDCRPPLRSPLRALAALPAPQPPDPNPPCPLPVSRRPRPPLGGGNRLRGRRGGDTRPFSPAASRLLCPRGASPPLFLPPAARLPALRARPGSAVPLRCPGPGGRLPGGPRASEPGLPPPRPPAPLGGCRLGARPRALPARPEGNAPARSWWCGRLRGTSGSTVCGKVVCLPG